MDGDPWGSSFIFGILCVSVLNFIQKKIAHLVELTPNQRTLIFTFLLYGFAAPLVVTYSGTYVWRNSESITLLCLFIGLYPVGLSIGFLLNGLALRKLQINKLYALGCLVIGAAPYVLVSVPFNWANVLLSGLLLGLASGLYYANRNLLTGIMTAGRNKYAFISVEGVVSTLTQMISPVLIGFFIVSGARFGIGSVTESYQYVAIVGFCILVLSGLFAIYMNVGGTELARPALVVPRSYVASTLFRMDIYNGMIDGVEAILGVLFVLIYLGQEDTVGSIQTIATIISVIVLGLTGHMVKARHFYKIISAWGVSFVVSAWVVAMFLGPVGVLFAILIPAFMRPFRWAVLGSLLHGSIDKALRNHGGDRFSYLFQREWRLNIGRILGAVFLLVLFTLFGQDAMLRYGYVIAAFALVPLIAHVRRLVPLQ